MSVHRLLAPLALAPLLLLGPAPAATSGTAAPAPQERRGNEAWSTVSTGDVSLLAQPAMLRTADGVLHVAYEQVVGAQDEYEHATISSAGAVTGHSKVLAPWNTLLADPQLVPTAGGGLRLVFSGLQDADSANFYSQGFMYHAVSDASGATWSVPAEALTRSASAYASYGTAATVLPDLTPFAGFALNSVLTWRSGTIPQAALWPPPGTATPDASTAVSHCCAYHTSLVQSGGSVWMAWYANGHTADSEGVMVRQVHPTLGPLLLAPGGIRPTGSQYDSFAPSQAVPLVARPGGGVVAAYCTGTYACERLMVWDVTTGTVKEVPGARGAQHFAMDSSPSGRLWVTWIKNDVVYAARSAETGLAFGAVRSLGAPGGSSSLYKIEVEALDGTADVVVNDGDRLSHVKARPALRFKATPKKWDGDRAQVVRFKVSDADGGVSGAKVRAGGQRCRTNGAGKCSIRFAPRGPGRIVAKATKSGFAPARLTLRVRP